MGIRSPSDGERLPPNEISRFEPMNICLRKSLIIDDLFLRFIGRGRALSPPRSSCQSSRLGLAILLALSTAAAFAAEPFVQISPRDPRYFELSDGRPYIPIGLNLIHPDTRDSEGLQRMEEWMGKLAANGGNYIRVWISSGFWDIEHQRSGVYDEAKARRIDEMLKMARRHGIRVKLTLEHFREMTDQPRQSWANKPLHLVANGGTATNMADFFDGPASRELFKKKLAWLANRYGNDPTIYGWELWNEVNAVRTSADHYMPWTETMLAELHRLFPSNLAMQSLGSFDNAQRRGLYRQHSLLAGNDVAQVHRYLDLGAPWEICHGPVDLLAADSVRELLSYGPKKPVVLAESGAVESSHSGPFKLYAKDKDGIILHDVLFAPFFAGAAGAGQIWHWDVYVARNNLWHQFGRFAAAVKDFVPSEELFQPMQVTHPRLRVYALKGRHTVLLWCRDSKNTWQTELADSQPPETLTGEKLDLAGILSGNRLRSVKTYDPWKDVWSEAKADGLVVPLPAFSRSLVVRLALAE